MAKQLLFILTLLGIACGEPATSTMGEHPHDHAAASSLPENQVQLTDPQRERAALKIGMLTEREMGSALEVNGKLELPPQSSVSISTPYGGFLRRTNMLPGTPVKKGQVVATIENPAFIQIQQDYLESLGQQQYLQKDYERKQELFTQQVASAKQFEKAESDYQVNQARLKAAEARLRMLGLNPDKVKTGTIRSRINLYAPITGRIKQVYISVGQYVNPEDVIMDIANLEHMHVELTVFERDLPKLSVGQELDFWLASNPEQAHAAEIYLIGAEVREDRSVTVHAHVEEEEIDLLPGMYISAAIETGAEKSPTLPAEAVARFEGNQYVFLVQDSATHRFEMVEVQAGPTAHGFTRIRFTDGKTRDQEKFVIEGAYTLLSVMKNEGEEHDH